MSKRTYYLTALLLLPLLAVPVTAQADIIRYVDAEGTIHFTDRKVSAPYVIYKKTKRQTVKKRYRRKIDANAYHSLIQNAGRTHGVDPALIYCVIEAESSFDHRAVSHAGARGLMQLMPATATRYGVRDVHDPEENIDGGTRYLKDLLVRYDGDLKRSLAAYNAGEKAVTKYDGVPPYRETKRYVRKILKRYLKTPGTKRPLLAGAKVYRYR